METKGHGYIRDIVKILAKKKGGKYPSYGCAKLAELLGVKADAIPSAIGDFRRRCTDKLGCDANAIIETGDRGYTLVDWMEVEVANETVATSHIDADMKRVVSVIKRIKKGTRNQIIDESGVSLERVKQAISRLAEEGVVDRKGMGANATYRLRQRTD